MAISTETVVLKVEAQTDGAIRATERLAQAQQKLADGFRSAIAGGDDMMARLGDGIRSLPSATGKLGESLRAIGLDAQTFAGGLKDIGKGLTFDLIRTGLKSLNKDIGDTASATLGAAVNGASMGAAFGGPLGAAIGGAAGAMKGLVGSLMEAEDQFKKQKVAAEAAGKAYWDAFHAAEKKKKIDADMAETNARLADEEKKRAEALGALTRVMNGMEEKERKAWDDLTAYKKLLWSVNGELRYRLELEGRLAAPKSDYSNERDRSQELDAAKAIVASRGVRDAQLAGYAATKSYGDTLISLEGPENARLDRMRDLEDILSDQHVSQEIQNKAYKEYNELLGVTVKKTEDIAKKLREIEEANLKAWKPLIDQLNGTADKDPWASVRAIEARAAALADYDVAVEEKTREIESARPEPNLEEDLRKYDLDEKLKKEREGKAAPKTKSKIEEVLGPVEEFDAYKESLDALSKSFDAFGSAVGASYEVIVTGQGSVSKAFRSIMADGLMAIGKSSAIEALRETALGFGSAALGPIGGASAAMHFKAAALHGAVAVAAGLAANALGTSVQNAAADKAAEAKKGEQSSAGSSGSSSGGSGSSGSGGSSSSEGARPIVVVTGDAFSELSPRQRQKHAQDALDRAMRERDE